MHNKLAVKLFITFTLLSFLPLYGSTLIYDTMNSEIPGNFINRIVGDDHGGFYVCTNGGLVRYKGYFEKIDLPENRNYHVNDAVLFKNTLYVATSRKGLLIKKDGKWNPLNDKDTVYSTISDITLVYSSELNEPVIYAATPEGLFYLKDETLVYVDKMPKISIKTLYYENDNLWAGSKQGIYFLSGFKKEIIEVIKIPLVKDAKSEDINNICVANNRVWFASNCGLLRLYKKQFRIYDFLNSEIKDTSINSLTYSGKDLYISGEKSLYKFTEGLIDIIPVELTRPVNSIYCTKYRDMGVDLWIGTQGQGLLRYNPDIRSSNISRTKENPLVKAPGDDNVVFYNVQDGLSAQTIKDVAVDELSFYSNKLIWIATDKGLCSFNGKLFTRYDTDNSGLSDNNINVVKVSGPVGYRYLWAGTMSGGLCRFDGKTWKVYNRSEGLVGDTIFDIEITKDGIWAATSFGAMFFNGKTWKHYTRENGLINDRVFDIVVNNSTSKSSVWFATELGISSFINGRFTSYSQWDGLKGFRFTKILPIGPERIIIGSSRNGITSFDGRRFINHSSSKMKFDQVQDFKRYKNSFFIATEKDVFSMDINNSASIKKMPYDLKGALPICLEIDGAYIWVGTNKGIYRFKADL